MTAPTITRPAEPDWPLEVRGARDLHERALYDALTAFNELGDRKATGTASRTLFHAILAVTVTRRGPGDYRAAWTLNQQSITRAGAQAALARHQHWVRTGQDPQEAA